MMMFQNGTEVAAYLDGIARELSPPRKLRVYVMAYRESAPEKMRALIGGADVCVFLDAWRLLDEPSRYEWVNQ